MKPVGSKTVDAIRATSSAGDRLERKARMMARRWYRERYMSWSPDPLTMEDSLTKLLLRAMKSARGEVWDEVCSDLANARGRALAKIEKGNK
jgi:hypothetical protein